MKLLQQLVSSAAASHPDRTALVYQQRRLSYGQLEAASNQLARLLKESGIGRGDRVAFLMPKTPEAIITILGTLKADAVYVPLDTASPAPRLAKIIDACQPRWIISGARSVALLEELMADSVRRARTAIGWLEAGGYRGEHVCTQFSQEDLTRYPADEIGCQNRPQDAAHILFTSGSTGVPKGVIITHENVWHFITWATSYFGTKPGDKISGHPPLHFDLSTFDLYGTLSAGAELHLVPVELNLLPHKLAEFIRTSELTQWFSVPSVLSFMAKADVVRSQDFPALQRLLWCGEVFPTPALMYWMRRLPHVRFTNLYGPTEATIASSYYTVPACPEDERAAIPIGTACPGEELLVLDQALHPVPTGEIGDLYIRGVGLSPGYWQDAEKTQAAFLANPRGGDPTDRIYKTGDLAKVGEDGLVYYLGRADSQIKSRGYRIELGEIETALNALQLAAEIAVVAVETAGFEGAVICCAYTQRPDQTVAPATLRSALSKVLPSYMLPTRWMQFERLPINANGKVDRPALRQAFQDNTTERATA